MVEEHRLSPTPEQIAEAEKWSSAIARYRSFPVVPGDPRSDRHQSWIAAATSSITEKNSAAKVGRFWSATADRLLKASFDPHFPSGAALFALGKLGSGELNLSSDVDIVIAVKEETAIKPGALRGFQKDLNEVTARGFVFRLDFDLRPGGRMGPLLPTVDQFVDYYGNYGETWERMAFVRLRAIAGDREVIDPIEKFAHAFSFRKHLDYGLLNDFKSIRTKVHTSRVPQADSVHLKLDRGGIRDTELYVHALQVIHGGKDPGLRSRDTTESLALLARKGLLRSEDAAFLTEHYWRLRALENFTQALNDEQTHSLSWTQALPAHLEGERARIKADMVRCDQIVSDLLGDPPKPQPIAWNEADPELKTLTEEILALPVLSRNKEHDTALRKDFVEAFVRKTVESGGSLRTGLGQLKDFLQATRAKSNFFEMLLRQDALMDQIVRLFSYSRYLGRLLCYRPELLDSFVLRVQDLQTNDMELLLENLVEKRLLTEILEGSAFLSDLNIARLSETLANVADEIVLRLMAALKAEHPSAVQVLALGKWGSRELGFQSDLDLLFVCADAPTPEDHKFVRRLISRLTEPHRGGSIYPIDMRLRPTGQAGPILIAAGDLKTFLESQAAAWERQAYLRARWLQQPLFDISQALYARELTKDELQELTDIRRRLLEQHQHLSLKYSDGGLLDIELFAQTQALQRRLPQAPGNIVELLRALNAEPLAALYSQMRQIEQAAQLITASPNTDFEDEKNEALQTLAALLRKSPQTSLKTHVESLFSESRQHLACLDPRRAPG